MKNPLSKFLGLLLLALVSFSGYSAYNTLNSEPTLGATNPIPTVVALFETTLASSISSTATSFNLTSGMTKDGVTLASSTYGFIIDEGTASEEFVLADCTNTVCTNVQRGVSVISGTSTVTALQKAHRRGASVKITNGPQLMIISNVFNGVQGFPRIVKYATSISTTTIASDGRNLVSVDLLNATVFNTAGIVAATEASAGFVELSTQNEMGSSTVTGTNGPLVVQAKYSTSTRPSSGFWNIISLATGYISETFLPKTLTDNYTYTGSSTFTGTTTFTGVTEGFGTASSTLFTSTGTSTYTKNLRAKYIVVEVVSGGGGGSANSKGGGGGGGYAKKIYLNTDLPASVNLSVGAGGSAGNDGGVESGGTGGTSNFNSTIVCTGGLGGSNGSYPGGGGTCTGGLLNIVGGGGTYGETDVMPGAGGNTQLGSGGVLQTSSDSAGVSGNLYGGGGSSGRDNGGSTSGTHGGPGASGIVIVTEYF